MWINTAEQRNYNSAMRKQAARRELAHTVCELVIAEVHPGNLGVLPPSPEVLLWKAVQIGLLCTTDEAVSTLKNAY